MPNRHVVLCRALAIGIALAALPAAADDAEDVGDLDGDGDVDADDRAMLKAAEEVIEIVDKSEGRKLVESARAVTVIDAKRARERTADLGEVLSRAQGIQVRRSGGLGSSARFSLNGLYDEQVRFFLDGVPLELAGWGLGIANVPVELIQRIDVHRGVVPIDLGADALGGAVDLVTDPSWVDRAAASLQTGSFGTYRGSALARVRDDATGAAAGLSLFFDRAANDYPVYVDVPDALGRPQPTWVRRFHDGYTAAGGSVELGVVERGPLRRALLRLYSTQYTKELQHNLVMAVPYGDAVYGEVARGVTADVRLERGPWSGRLLAGIARRRIRFEDTGEFIYDWYGNRIGERRRPGELGTLPIDQLVVEDGAFARLVAQRTIGARHALRAVIAPTAALRHGEDYTDPNPDGRDPLSARRDLVQLVSGVEHQARGFRDRLENIAFLKTYLAWADAEDVRPGFQFVPLEQRARRFGLGDAVRWRWSKRLTLKASYEWATRLPTADEIFGDGILVQPNLELEPERSHNLNVGARLEDEVRYGSIAVELSTFARLADQLITMLGDDRFFTYQNVWEARILGIEGSGGWVAPGEWASVEAAFTVQDLRNASSDGTFGAYEGDRIPNRPWLLGSLGANARRTDVFRAGDEVTLFASSRYVHAFFRGRESLGARDSKQVIASQLAHGAGITYARRGITPVLVTVEVQNLTDARLFDSYGVQRPGRAVYLKLSGEL